MQTMTPALILPHVLRIIALIRTNPSQFVIAVPILGAPLYFNEYKYLKCSKSNTCECMYFVINGNIQYITARVTFIKPKQDDYITHKLLN